MRGGLGIDKPICLGAGGRCSTRRRAVYGTVLFTDYAFYGTGFTGLCFYGNVL